MPLTQHQRKHMLAWVEQHYEKCPNCGFKGAHVTDVVSMHLVEKYEGGNVVTGDTFVVFIPVICKKCQHTSLFNSKQILPEE